MKQVNEYTYNIIWSEEDQEFVGLCAEFPSLSWLAKSQEEAWAGIISLVANTLDDIKNNNQSL